MGSWLQAPYFILLIKGYKNMKKVIIRIVGGLGNQLFCYAAACRLARVNNAELVIDDTSGFVHDPYRRRYQLDHFNIACRKATVVERLEPFSRIRRYLKRAYNRYLPFEERTYIQQEGINFDPRLLQVRPRDTVYLEGYWQSEGYFKDIEQTIREHLRISPPTDIANQEMGLSIQNTLAVAIHVRFFDAPHAPGPHNVSNDYYTRAVMQMEKWVPCAHYFIFSDQPDAARARIPLPDQRITCVAHHRRDASAYSDLWLMTQCQHFIIANSTFSWWGAWLGEEQGKHVVAPALKKMGKTSWGFEGLIPDRWMLV